MSPPGPQALWEQGLGYFHSLLYLSLLLSPSALLLCGKNYFICDKGMVLFISNLSLTDYLQTYKTWNIQNTSPFESESRSVVSDSLWPHGLHSPWDSPGLNTGVGSLSLLQVIFPAQGSNPGLPFCRWIIYQLSHREAKNTGVGSLSLLQQILPTQESNRGLLHCRQILYNWAIRKAHKPIYLWLNSTDIKFLCCKSKFRLKLKWGKPLDHSGMT